METVDCVVIGAGVVGLACARSLAEAGREVVILERETGFGSGISARNSEVIHAGLYYPPGSLKARLCVEGRELLYAWCAERGVAHARCGKLVVAARAEQMDRLQQIAARARANGVTDLRLLERTEVAALEPALDVHAALLSPSTGIVDSHAFMLALRGEIEDAGGALAFHAPLLSAKVVPEGFEIEIGGESPMSLQCRLLINSAGLAAPAIARAIEGMPADHIPTAYYAKGNYFSCSTRAPFSHLIYPVPEPGGLGVHLTIDLGGQAKFGPDVEWIDEIDYAVDPTRADRFYPAIRRYWPTLPDGALTPSYSGIRPKIVPPAVARQDFVIEGAGDHGVAGLINLFGIESPGLTSSLAIADDVARRAGVQG